MSNRHLAYGLHPVRALLEREPGTVDRLLVTHRDRGATANWRHWPPNTASRSNCAPRRRWTA